MGIDQTLADLCVRVDLHGENRFPYHAPQGEVPFCGLSEGATTSAKKGGKTAKSSVDVDTSAVVDRALQVTSMLTGGTPLHQLKVLTTVLLCQPIRPHQSLQIEAPFLVIAEVKCSGSQQVCSTAGVEVMGVALVAPESLATAALPQLARIADEVTADRGKRLPISPHSQALLMVWGLTRTWHASRAVGSNLAAVIHRSGLTQGDWEGALGAQQASRPTQAL